MGSVTRWMAAIAVAGTLLSIPVFAEQAQDTRDQTRRKLGQLLDGLGPKVNMTFRQHKETEWTYVGVLSSRLIYADRMEVYLLVTDQDEIRFQVFPLYKEKYINLDKVKDTGGLMRRMLGANLQGFFYWGADRQNDIFAGYTITLESGFPAEAIEIVLKSVLNLDKLVGEFRQFIEGGSVESASSSHLGGKRRSCNDEFISALGAQGICQTIPHGSRIEGWRMEADAVPWTAA